MSRSIGSGAALYALGEVARAQNEANRAHDAATDRVAAARAQRDEAIEYSNQLAFTALSQIHGFRAQIQARRWVADELIAALHAENPGHPLAHREVIEALFDKIRDKAMFDESVIRKTYPDGVVPEGAILRSSGGSPAVIGGFPGYADPEARKAALSAAGLKNLTDRAAIKAAIADIRGQAASLKAELDEDETKGFFGRMNKKNRAESEEDYQTVVGHLKALERALVDAILYHEDTSLTAQEISDRLSNYEGMKS